MPAVPIDPSTIQNAKPFPTQSISGALPCSLSDKPAEGHRMVPFQCKFDQTPVWLVDLSNLTTQAQFSKVSTLYIDNTNSQHDVNILFPDTGFQTRIAFGDTAFIPVLQSTATPRFYVILDDGNVVNASDAVNIFALNFFVPPVLTSIYQRSISYGYSQFFQLAPTFTQSTAFAVGVTVVGIQAGATLINHQQWYLTGIQLSVAGQASSVTAAQEIQLFDNGVPIFNSGWTSGSVSQDLINLWNLSGLNFISSGNGALTAKVTDGGGGNALTTGNFFFNLFGGILVN